MSDETEAGGIFAGTLTDAEMSDQDLINEIEGTVMLIAQADTGAILRNHDNSRVRMLVEDARKMTKKYGFFDYWSELE